MQMKIVEVGPRDGLQNEAVSLSVPDRIQFIRSLTDAGIKFMEAGSFVSPKAIPQMVDSDKVYAGIEDLNSQADFSFLVPNLKGLERAMEARVNSIAVFSATSDTFNRKNIGMTVEDSLKNYEPIVQQAKKKAMRVRGYVSTAFGCPYEGHQPLERVMMVVGKLFDFGCDEVSVGDTIGVAHPAQVREIFTELSKSYQIEKLAGHFHDTRGMALVNIQTALEVGLRIFDSSLGGLGGCPYAKGASGNVATEEVVWLLEGFGLKTGINIEKLLSLCDWIKTRIGRELKAKFYVSQPKKLFYAK